MAGAAHSPRLTAHRPPGRTSAGPQSCFWLHDIDGYLGPEEPWSCQAGPPPKHTQAPLPPPAPSPEGVLVGLGQKEHPALLVEDSVNLKAKKEKMIQVMVEALTFLDKSVCSCHLPLAVALRTRGTRGPMDRRTHGSIVLRPWQMLTFIR